MVRVEVRQDHVGNLMPRQAELREAMQRPRAAVEQDLEVPPSHPMAGRRPGGRRRDRPGADGDQVHSGRLHLTESYPDDGRHAGLLHGDPVDGVGGLHGARVVGDDDELRQVLELREQAHVAAHIGVVEGRVHLIEQTEGTRLGEEDREQERHGDQRALTGREQVDPLRALAARCRVDLDLALERLVLVREPHVAFAAAEQRLEHRAEVLPHLTERVEEHRLRGLVDLARGLLEGLARRYEVIPLRHQELEALDLFAVLVHREGVDGSDRVDRRAQPLVLLAQPLEVARDLGRVGEQLIEGLPPFGLDPRDEPAPAAQDLGALELEFVLIRATGGQRRSRALERRCRLGDARVRRLDLDPGLSGGALQGHEREAALLELVLPLGLLRREGRRVVLQRAHLLDERRGLTARFLDLRRGAPARSRAAPSRASTCAASTCHRTRCSRAASCCASRSTSCARSRPSRSSRRTRSTSCPSRSACSASSRAPTSPKRACSRSTCAVASPASRWAWAAARAASSFSAPASSSCWRARSAAAPAAANAASAAASSASVRSSVVAAPPRRASASRTSCASASSSARRSSGPPPAAVGPARNTAPLARRSARPPFSPPSRTSWPARSARTHAAAGPSTRRSSLRGWPSAASRGPGTLGNSTSGPGCACSCQRRIASTAAASRTSTACSHSPSSCSASTASRRVVRTKSDKGPITASPNCSRALSSAWAAGASPTRSRSSSARASCRAVTCARAPSAWRRAARPWVSCSLSSATHRRACSRPAAACAAARASAVACSARVPT